MIRVADLVRGELPVSAADDVVFAVVNEQVLRVGRLVVEGQHAGGEDAAGGFQVAVAVVDANDLHVLKMFHKVPLFRSFGVKVMFLIQNLLLFVNLFIFMGVPCLFPARNLVWLTVSPEEALASGKGACNSGIWENRKVVAVYRARNFGCSCRGSCDPWSHEQDTAIPVMTLRTPQI